jgi:hypothetical protein
VNPKTVKKSAPKRKKTVCFKEDEDFVAEDHQVSDDDIPKVISCFFHILLYASSSCLYVWSFFFLVLVLPHLNNLYFKCSFSCTSLSFHIYYMPPLVVYMYGLSFSWC